MKIINLVILCIFVLLLSCQSNTSCKYSPEVFDFDNHNKHSPAPENILPVQSFVKVSKLLTNDKKEKYINSGSGFIIHSSLLKAHIMTAGHVCLVDDSKLKIEVLFITTIDGTDHLAEVLKIDIVNDICILIVDEYVGKPAITLSPTEPKLGQQVFSIAAPAGFFYPNTVPIFEGFFSGKVNYSLDKTDPKAPIVKTDIYSIFLFPGGSGSPVVNRNGQLVGMLLSYLRDVPNHITMSTSYHILKQYVEEFK